MKFRLDKKYFYWGLTALTVLILAILFYYLVFHGTNFGEHIKRAADICSPIIDGLIIAFLLCPLINWIEKKFLFIFAKKKSRRELSSRKQNVLRVLTILVSFIFVGFLIFAFFYSIIPQILLSIENIASQSSAYKTNLENWMNDSLSKNPEVAKFVNDTWESYSSELSEWKNNNLIPQIESLVKKVSLSVFNFLGAMWDILIGSIISIYVLYHKEKFSGQFKKLIYGFAGIRNGNSFIKNIRIVNQKFSGFIIGKLLDSLIIGILCFIGCKILNFPYPLLLSLIVGVTNIIPFFGPIIGAIPCAIIIIMVHPVQFIYFLIFILALQQFDGNILGPKILGVSTGISSFWVIFSITVFGGIWGVPGMIIGVPLFAVIYAGIKTILTNHLKKKGLPMNTDQYIPLDYIDEEKQNEFILIKTDENLSKIKRTKVTKKTRKTNDDDVFEEKKEKDINNANNQNSNENNNNNNENNNNNNNENTNNSNNNTNINNG